jgi:hypothetical protein
VILVAGDFAYDLDGDVGIRLKAEVAFAPKAD